MAEGIVLVEIVSKKCEVYESVEDGMRHTWHRGEAFLIADAEEEKWENDTPFFYYCNILMIKFHNYIYSNNANNL